MADLFEARRRFIESGRIDRSVRPVVAESWRRSRRLGVDPMALRRQRRDPSLLERAQATNRRLIEAADPHLLPTHRVFGDHAHLLALADAEARILRLLAPAAQLAAGEESNLFAGASWDEGEIGCNGVGTCLVANEPVILIGPEHLVEDYVGWTCIGVPLRDRDGRIAGALDLSVPNEAVNVHTWGWVLSVARAIERDLHRLPASAAVPPADSARHPESEVRDTPAALDDPFSAIHGIFELLVRQLSAGPTHGAFIDEARRQVDGIEETLRRTVNHLSATESELKAADREKDAFLALLGHELRTPLSSLTAGLRLMEEVAPADPVHAQALAVMRRQVQGLSRLVDDLSALTRIDRGTLHLAPEPVDLRDILGDAVAGLRAQATKKGIRVHLQLPDHPADMSGDPVRLAQVAANLLGNAIKYTPAGGRIDVACTLEADTIRFEVRDSGVGIAPGDLPHVFDRFVRAERPGDRRAPGLGLGLFLVKTFVELHGGRVAAESPGVGRGTRMIVRLPRA
jgi:signal transduction histidine kinase